MAREENMPTSEPEHQKVFVKSEPQEDSRKPDEASVEILGLPDAEGVRNDAEEQASECSSSFANTEDENFEAGESGEVQSSERNGNGALWTSDERRKKALNLDWRSYRRGIEWRCRWLDLRLMQLQRQAIKYDEVLSRIHKSKCWDSISEEETGAARAFPTPPGYSSHPLLHRQKRKRVEELVDVTEYMSNHPLFQRYEKRKRENLQECVQPKDSSELAEEAKAKVEQQEEEEAGASNEGTIENFMVSLEILQSRVSRLRNQLRGSMSHKLPGQIARGLARNPVSKTSARPRNNTCSPSGAAAAAAAAAGVGGVATPLISPAAAAAKGSPALRRRSSDFDINNVILPVSAGSKYVEHIRHAHIETPQWRSADNPSTSDPGGGNNEDTDDETYRARHEALETRERNNTYSPRVNKKAGDGDSGSSKSSKGGGKMTGPMQCSLSSQYSEI